MTSQPSKYLAVERPTNEVERDETVSDEGHNDIEVNNFCFKLLYFSFSFVYEHINVLTAFRLPTVTIMAAFIIAVFVITRNNHYRNVTFLRYRPCRWRCWRRSYWTSPSWKHTQDATITWRSITTWPPCVVSGRTSSTKIISVECFDVSS